MAVIKTQQDSTFNARIGSLGTSPLWKKRFQAQRAVIPASGFHEWTGPKGRKQCHNIRPADGAIALAGLYEWWDFEGEIIPSFTIITLPPHARFEHIHPKAFHWCYSRMKSTCGWTRATPGQNPFRACSRHGSVNH
ncbi:SOS response-associated peptidase family protein [Marinobacter alexandrii]|uniref:SOS response-associated peptidase family protein n=1 Tax=Marinobacter alexandrii TaxID=2570351 RepID=UPI002ABD269F|nr:SOS response-associated peptidase family protein [Marinobacter alexandrii]